MFLPEAADEKKQADARRKLAFNNIEGWCLGLVPEDIRADALISAQEVACGDPYCSPIDTSVSIIFTR